MYAPEATPRVRIESECARRGRDAVVADCVALLGGEANLRSLTYLAGAAAARKYFDDEEHHDTYWFRVWALRGLLWAWDPVAEGCVRAALSDEAWRVREMAAKVVARHQVGEAVADVAALHDDPVPRVRYAAQRALRAVTAAGA